jgi:hypothetical protein
MPIFPSLAAIYVSNSSHFLKPPQASSNLLIPQQGDGESRNRTYIFGLKTITLTLRLSQARLWIRNLPDVLNYLDDLSKI